MCWHTHSVFLLQTTTDIFLQKYKCYLEEFKNNPQSANWTTDNSVAHAYISFTYDGVWAMAFALDETEKELKNYGSNYTLANFTYFNGTPEIGDAIQKHLNATNFRGVSVSWRHN